LQQIRPMGEIVGDILAEFPIPQLAAQGATSPGAAEAFREYTAAVRGQIQAGESYRARRAELQAQEHTMPADGMRIELQKARRQAETDSLLHAGAASRSFARLEEELTDAALPRVSFERESLARQEFDTALSGSNPEAAVLTLAGHGSREAVAVLFTGYGATKLEAAGVEDPGRVLREAKKLAAAAAIERGSSVREVGSAKVLQQLGRLAAAKGAAGGVLHRALYEDDAAAHRALELADSAAEAREG
jgi:hypothetical protein